MSEIVEQTQMQQANPPIIHAVNLRKRYGKQLALDDMSFDIHAGRIVGIIGANGSGKTTTLKALLGLEYVEGELSVLGLDPRKQRDAVVREVCFVADVAILPKWLKVKDAMNFFEGVHPRFRREKAEKYLASTKIKPSMRVQEMSKGMVAQLHLSLAMAIDAKILVLDEPTLGLDIFSREAFYTQLLNDYFDAGKTIIITTHQIEELQNILTDVIFVQDGKVALQTSMENIAEEYCELMVHQEHFEAALALSPIARHSLFGKEIMLFKKVAPEILKKFGDIRIPDFVDVFMASVKRSEI